MSARARIVELARSSNVNTKFVIEMFDLFLEAAKEEIQLCPFPEPCTDTDPQEIQGYTAEQWQEIIDGGYLCEGYVKNDIWIPIILKKLIDAKANQFIATDGYCYSRCRPAQLKGVMRPIFVEPVDKEAGYIFFDRRGSFLGTSNFFTGATWNEVKGCCVKSDSIPAKYIEV